MTAPLTANTRWQNLWNILGGSIPSAICNSFAQRLYKIKGRVCWVGDYADDNGDFHEGNIGYEKVGKWAWHLISISDKVPKNYKKMDLVFKEIL